MVLGDENPLDGKLATTMLAPRATVHTATQYTPAQLVFGRDSIINLRHEVDWKIKMRRKQDLINKGSERENHNRINDTYEKRRQDLTEKCVEDKIQPRLLLRSLRNHSCQK